MSALRSLGSGRWAPPLDNFAPTIVNAQFQPAPVLAAVDSTLPLGSMIGDGPAASQRSSVSARRSFSRPAAPQFATANGPITDEEAVAMFQRMDLNLDGVITHAELMRGLLYMPEIAGRLAKSGDAAHAALSVRVANHELKLPESDSFTLQEWVNFCQPAGRTGKAQRFVVAYNLAADCDAGSASCAGADQTSSAIPQDVARDKIINAGLKTSVQARAAEHAAELQTVRTGAVSPLRQAPAVVDRSNSVSARADEILRRHTQRQQGDEGASGSTVRANSEAVAGDSICSEGADRGSSVWGCMLPVSTTESFGLTSGSGADAREVVETTKALVHVNHRLTRELQMCFNKAEEDELRVKEALLKERAVEREMQALQAQQRLEMQVAADKLGSEYAKQTEALHREQAAARAAAQADHQRELEAQARRFEQEIALVQDQVAAERAAVDGELAQTRVQCDQLLTAERGWAERHATLEERVATMEGEHAAAVRALDAERQASMEARAAAETLRQELAAVTTELQEVKTAHVEQEASLAMHAEKVRTNDEVQATLREEAATLRAEVARLDSVAESLGAAHAEKEREVREALDIGRTAVAERDVLAQRLRAVFDELQVVLAVAHADDGHMHASALDGAMQVLGSKPDHVAPEHTGAGGTRAGGGGREDRHACSAAPGNTAASRAGSEVGSKAGSKASSHVSGKARALVECRPGGGGAGSEMGGGTGSLAGSAAELACSAAGGATDVHLQVHIMQIQMHTHARTCVPACLHTFMHTFQENLGLQDEEWGGRGGGDSLEPRPASHSSGTEMSAGLRGRGSLEPRVHAGLGAETLGGGIGGNLREIQVMRLLGVGGGRWIDRSADRWRDGDRQTDRQRVRGRREQRLLGIWECEGGCASVCT